MDRYKESSGSGQTGQDQGQGQGGSHDQGGSDEITIKVKVSKDALRQAVKDAGGTIAK